MIGQNNHLIHSIWQLLHITYGIVPIVAGIDKFTHFLVDWEKYLHPAIAGMFPDPHTFMIIVGVIEIIAGILVLAKPLVGGYVVMGWLIAISLQLIAAGNYYDVAVRDIVMACGAYSLARLSAVVQPQTAKVKTTVTEPT